MAQTMPWILLCENNCAENQCIVNFIGVLAVFWL